MPADIETLIGTLDKERPVLLAGPTASGKSALALRIAECVGGPVINADAIQVYADWRVLTARPSQDDEARWPHKLYGHVPGDAPYSVGAWLRDLAPCLEGPPPVIVGGTGLYFAALTGGLAEIPEIPDVIRKRALERLKLEGAGVLLGELDSATRERIDTDNPMRVQRAWEVLQATGKGLADWREDTGPPVLPLSRAQPIVLDAPATWLNPRIETRWERMLADGVLDEARANRAAWRPDLPSAKAIGAEALMRHFDGRLGLEEVRDTIVTLTRQYAKRQRSWFRGRMKDWTWIEACEAKPD
ncbi:MAG: tRNA (adenosine(37)-N6)-dimethylallyltransferase MiaA [Paracoccaceae bacterium]|nr:tRNA (adenosine(37)-N6)-dimethylallyltransferase MiaA [Paracoccaceae bacterium]